MKILVLSSLAYSLTNFRGTLLTAMAVTGTMIYAMRLARSARSDVGSLKIAWRGMGAWGYIGIALILLTLILTPGAIGGAS